jgi:septum site-determining protein MinD
MSPIIAIVGMPKSGKSTLGLNLASAFERAAFLDAPAFSLSTIEQLKNSYEKIVVDCGSDWEGDVREVLENAHIVLVTTEAQPKQISDTRKLLDKLYTFLPRDLVYAILNHYQTKSPPDPMIIKRQLGCNILGALPEDPSIPHTAAPFVVTEPKSVPSQYIFQLKKIIETKKILEKGESIQARRGEARLKEAQEPAPLKPQLYRRFVKEELDPRTQRKITVMKQLSSELNLKKLDTETGNDPKKIALLRQKTRQAVEAIMEREKIDAPMYGNRPEREQFIKEILDEALGLGPLEQLLADSTITEIMVNRKDQIYVEKEGKIFQVPMTFTSDQQLLGIIERIVAPLGRRIDEKTPYVDARLPDGSRVHAIIPPLALQGPVITIRKFPERNYTVTDLTRFSSLTEEIADFMRAAIEARLNCVISGGTGSGKTTLLNIFSSFIPLQERIITVEDSAELRLIQPHVIRLESRPPNIEGTGAVTIRDLVRNTLRMRPDRIVVGECRDGAALDMLQAMNTGHDGSLTTIHANSPRDCLSRLETLVMMAGMELPSRAIREQVASAIDFIVQVARFSDGSRKIINITEVTGMEKDVITLAEVIVFKQKGIDAAGRVYGTFEFTGYVPRFIHELEKQGLRLPKGFFTKKTAERGS